MLLLPLPLPCAGLTDEMAYGAMAVAWPYPQTISPSVPPLRLYGQHTGGDGVHLWSLGAGACWEHLVDQRSSDERVSDEMARCTMLSCSRASYGQHP